MAPVFFALGTLYQAYIILLNNIMRFFGFSCGIKEKAPLRGLFREIAQRSLAQNSRFELIRYVTIPQMFFQYPTQRAIVLDIVPH
jgi:hypothetical protein